MSVQQMRAAIYEVYPGRRWKIKVQNMPDDQVIAVYYSFLAKGKFDQKPAAKEPKTYVTEKGADTDVFKPFIGEQINIDI